MKLFKTNNIDSERNCQKEFAFQLPSVILARLSEHFSVKYNCIRIVIGPNVFFVNSFNPCALFQFETV